MNFPALYDTTIRAIETSLEAIIDSGHDFELDRAGDVLTLTFDDGERIVITPQAPMNQIWVSANYEGHRFNYTDEVWLDEKSGAELKGYLSVELGRKLGDATLL